MQHPRLHTPGSLPSSSCHSSSSRFVSSFLFSRFTLSPTCRYIFSLPSTSARRSSLASTLRLAEQTSHQAICCISPMMALQSWQSSRQVSFSVRQRGKSHSFISSFLHCICSSLSNFPRKASHSSGPSRPMSSLVSVSDDILLRCSLSYVETLITFKYLKRSATMTHVTTTSPPTEPIINTSTLLRQQQAASPPISAREKSLRNSILELRKRQESDSRSLCSLSRFFQFSASLMVLRMEENLDSQVLRPRRKKRTKVRRARAGRKQGWWGSLSSSVWRATKGGTVCMEESEQLALEQEQPSSTSIPSNYSNKYNPHTFIKKDYLSSPFQMFYQAVVLC